MGKTLLSAARQERPTGEKDVEDAKRLNPRAATDTLLWITVAAV